MSNPPPTVSIADLDEALKPHIKPCSLITLRPAEGPHSPIASRFGGLPYLEAGETWPQCSTCLKDLSFIAQLDLRETPVREPLIDLFAFYYCWSCAPESHAVDAWEVRAYLLPRDEDAVALEPAEGTRRHPPCLVTFHAAQSLPDFDTALSVCPEAVIAARAVNPESVAATYSEACERLVGAQPITSVAGGYPRWVMGDEGREDARFFAQLDSEAAADVVFNDAGVVFLFLTNEEPPTLWMAFQATAPDPDEDSVEDAG